MKHQCALLLQLFLLGLLPILILSSESPDRGNIIDVSSNAKTKPEGDMHWIVQRDAVLKRRRQRKARGKMKLEKRIKKCKKKSNAAKKGQRAKSMRRGAKRSCWGESKTKTNCVKG